MLPSFKKYQKQVCISNLQELQSFLSELKLHGMETDYTLSLGISTYSLGAYLEERQSLRMRHIFHRYFDALFCSPHIKEISIYLIARYAFTYCAKRLGIVISALLKQNVESITANLNLSTSKLFFNNYNLAECKTLMGRFPKTLSFSFELHSMSLLERLTDEGFNHSLDFYKTVCQFPRAFVNIHALSISSFQAYSFIELQESIRKSQHTELLAQIKFDGIQIDNIDAKLGDEFARTILQNNRADRLVLSLDSRESNEFLPYLEQSLNKRLNELIISGARYCNPSELHHITRLATESNTLNTLELSNVSDNDVFIQTLVNQLSGQCKIPALNLGLNVNDRNFPMILGVVTSNQNCKIKLSLIYANITSLAPLAEILQNGSCPPGTEFEFDSCHSLTDFDPIIKILHDPNFPKDITIHLPYLNSQAVNDLFSAMKSGITPTGLDIRICRPYDERERYPELEPLSQKLYKFMLTNQLSYRTCLRVGKKSFRTCPPDPAFFFPAKMLAADVVFPTILDN